MASATMVIGDVIVSPALVLEYADATFNDLFAGLEQTFAGAIEVFPPDEDVKPGNYINRPALALVGEFSRRDLTATGDTDAVAAGADVQNRGPVCSSLPTDSKPLLFTDASVRGYKRTPESYAAALGEQMAMRAFTYRKQRIYDALRGAITAIVASTHVYHPGAAAICAHFLSGKALMKDASQKLTTLIMHSNTWYKVLADAGTSSSINQQAIADGIWIKGGLPALVGLNIFVDDQVPVVDLSADDYCSFLLGRGAVQLHQAPRVPLFTMEQKIFGGARAVLVTLEDHFGIVIPNMDMASNNTNSTAAQLYTSGNWAEAFSDDHRDVKAVMVKTHDG